MKPGKTRRKIIEGKGRHYDKGSQRQKPLADRQRVGGRQDEERRLKENAGAMTRETNIKNLPRTASAAGGGRDEESENQHELERLPIQSREGRGRAYIAENA